MKFHHLQFTTGIVMVVTLFIITALASSQNKEQNQLNVTIFPTPTGWITPDPTQLANMGGIFPSNVSCSGVMPPYEGPNWEWIHIGETTFKELVDHLETTAINATLRGVGWNEWSILFSDEDFGQQQWEICVTKGRITTLSIRNYAESREAFVWDAIANWGPPDAVARTWHSTTRAYFWFERGIALTVFVWQESENVEYGRIMEVTYFPYVDPNNYEGVYPYNQTNIALGGLPARTSIPIELDPLDYDAILATVTPGTITDVIGGE